MTKMRHKMTTKSKTTKKIINKTTETQNDNKETQGDLKQSTKQSRAKKLPFSWVTKKHSYNTARQRLQSIKEVKRDWRETSI